MPIAKVRGLSQFGILTDVDAYNLPPQAFSRGVNVRFRKGSVERAPIFRRIDVELEEEDPRYVASNLPTSGFDALYIGHLNGRVTTLTGGASVDISVFGYVEADSELPYTSCNLQEVFYFNRGDRVPWSFEPSDTEFGNLANWDTNWRCQILRSCGGALCAFHITGAGGTPSISGTFPTMVLTSEFALVQNEPADWDFSDPNSNATQNTLGGMQGPIVDAMNFGDDMIIYGTKEAWLMQADGSDDIWSYRKLPFDRGVLNTNCAVEVEGYHYVFGIDDIWRHDGNSMESVVDQKVREYIFNNMDLQKAHRCFIFHDKARKELRFCYVSGDDMTGFVNNDGCNRAAVYDLKEGTWTFDDLPYVYGMAFANINTAGLTWASVTDTWETISGTWLGQGDGLKRVSVAVGDVDATYSLQLSIYAIDNQGPGALVTAPVDTNATLGWRLHRDGIDLDELEEVRDLRGYKYLSRLMPQARLEDGAEPISFQLGSADNYNQIPVFIDAQTYDADTETSIDCAVAGRYLSLRIEHDDYHWVRLTGFDLDLENLGSE